MAHTETSYTGNGSAQGTANGAGANFSAIGAGFDVWLKTAHLFFDNTTKLSQTFADFYQAQANEGLKLAQTCFSTGKTVAEEMRTQFTKLADTATRQ